MDEKTSTVQILHRIALALEKLAELKQKELERG